MGTIETITSTAVIGRRLVVAKRRSAADRNDGAEVRRRTEHEGRWLVAAQHQGIVKLRRVSLRHGLVVTAHAGTATFRIARHPPPVMAAILATVATTIGELHLHGLVHSNLTADHVVLSGPDLTRPTLCSPAVGPFVDCDVVALGAMAEEVMARHHLADPAWTEAVDRLFDPESNPSPRTAAEIFSRLSRRRWRRWSRPVWANRFRERAARG